MAIDFARILASTAFFAVMCLTLVVFSRARLATREKSRHPFNELRRRPAGEFIRLKLEAIDEQIYNRSVYLSVFPGALCLLFLLIPHAGIAVFGLFLGLSFVGSVVFGKQLMALAEERRNYKLGFDGERFVGEELSGLIASGFDVYHDVQFGDFNIDHVAVGPPGVFAVETKARRKPVRDEGKKEFHVVFDGLKLLWPNGADERSVDQVCNNARTLSHWISGAVGEPVEVSAILTIPGWMVDRKAYSRKVQVCNPKEIIRFCKSREVQLSENLINRIRFQLDQKCKLGVA